jgi:hypothetical protein
MSQRAMSPFAVEEEVRGGHGADRHPLEDVAACRSDEVLGPAPAARAQLEHCGAGRGGCCNFGFVTGMPWLIHLR